MTARRFMPYNPEFADDTLEPSAHSYEAARAELGAWASDEQITARAFEIEDEATRLWNQMAEDDEAESRLDDQEEW